MSRWLGPLAGLALGAGLASLFFNNGLGGALAGILLAAALAFGIFCSSACSCGAARAGAAALRGRRSAGRPREMPREARGARAPTHERACAAFGCRDHSSGDLQRRRLPRWPGFDEAQFVRHARMNFVDLQSAYDRKDMAAIRDFVTPELAAEIEKDMRAAGPRRKTEVVTLDAEVLDVTTENGLLRRQRALLGLDA